RRQSAPQTVRPRRRRDERAAETRSQLPTMAGGGQPRKSSAKITAIFIANAASVLKTGQVPMNSVMPRNEAMAEVVASGLQSSAGSRTPEKDIAAATNPIMARAQKVPATSAAAGGASEGKR